MVRGLLKFIIGRVMEQQNYSMCMERWQRLMRLVVFINRLMRTPAMYQMR